MRFRASTLLNQYLIAYGHKSVAGLGNVNRRLYNFATSAPAAFHDITTGDNIVTVTGCAGFRCLSTTTQSVGYNASVGHDQVTGLGSIDVHNFVAGWPNITPSAAVLVPTLPTDQLSLSRGNARFGYIASIEID